tara:strand:+ start:1894 stop:4143 length:2250 start_codon:yes stop_codon:yes gene_type:complete
MARTPQEVEALRAEFSKLQAELNKLKMPTELVDGLKNLTSGLQQSFENLRQQKQAFEENAAAVEHWEKELTKARDKITGLARDTTEYTKAQKDLEKVQNQLAAANGANEASAGSWQATQAQLVKTLEKHNIVLAKAGKAQEAYNAAMAALMAGDLDKYNELMALAADETAKYADKASVGAAEAENLRNSVLGLSGGMQKLGGMITAGGAGFDGFVASMKESVMSGELFLNMALKMIDVNIGFALEQDKAIAEFRKATGAGKEFNEMILGTETRLRQSGVELGEAAEAYRTLKNEVVSFTYLTKEQQTAMADTTALLAEMGFGLGTQADIAQTAMESMNMTAEESQQLLTDIASTARSLGMDVDKMGQEFVANKEFIVGFGKDGAKVFEEMAVQAKSLGMEMGTLTGVVDKFTTFDQAGKAVGRLNAILGGPFLNSIDMLNAAMEDPAEAVNMLRDSFDQAGVSLEDMGRAEKMAFADALGMSIEDMTNMMGQSSEELEINRLEQEALAKQAAETMDITEKLRKAFQAMYIDSRPFIEDILIPGVEKLSALAQAMGNFFATKTGMITFFAVFTGLLVTAIALMASFALTSMAAATASMVGIPAATAAGVLLAKAGIAMGVAKIAAGVTLVGAVGMGIGAGAGHGPESTGGEKKKESKARPGFAAGGVVTATALVGEHGPELVEMPMGSRVTSAPSTAALTKAIQDLSRKLDRMEGPGNVAVYVGDKEVTDIVLKAINSPKGQRSLGAYGR